MKNIFYYLAISVLIPGCQFKKQGGDQYGSPETTLNHEGYRYVHLAGKINAKYDISMDLILENVHCLGYYSYQTTLQPIKFYGSYVGDSIILNCGGSRTDTSFDEFMGKFTGESFVGEWSNGKSKFPFTLKVNTGAVPFEIYQYKDSSILHTATQPYPQGRFSYDLFLPPGNSYPALQRLLAAEYTGSQTTVGMKQAVKKQAEQFIRTYQETGKSFLEEPNMLGSLNYTCQKTSEIVFNTNDIVVVKAGNYNYSGGAHGMYTSEYVTYNISTQRAIKLGDFFDIADSSFLKAQLTKNLRRDWNIADTSSLQDAGLFVTDSVLHIPRTYYVTPSGIMFVYGVYEIAAYANGEVQDFVSFRELKDAIKRQSWMKF